ncbi:PilZ domain-containing protein [Pelomonas sp. CA6]|uniref:PilZ domain-containing protein n=1 Tax=Pelomonas sp. CA6 TaxID=2907999 RepID=UPI001F4C17A4|nr:PilZ domain-containing protein [Pelomonas sp. CA6]MCH7344623.1 PilZ domain-containing protein [Pelomonas sp. CA6]
MSAERRHFARVAFNTPATLTTTDDRIQVHVLDLSLKGALLQLPAADQVQGGQPCLLEVRLAEGVRVTMAAEIAFAQDHRAGVLCRAIDIESVTHLRRLIEVNLGEQGLLERELKALVSA